jgi:hypothetical protein
MKSALPVIVGLCCFGALALDAATRLDAKAWSNVRTYEARSLSGGLDSHVGQLVGIKFTFRSKDIRHLKPNWYESAIWQVDPKGKKGFSSVRVMVAKNDLKAFKSIPTDSTSTEEITVYGKVSRDLESKFFFVRLLGRNTIVDPAGSAVVSW